MKFILGIINALFGRLIDTAVAGIKFEAAALYVSGVRKTRQAFIALIGLAVCLLLATSGFLLMHVALFVWLPLSSTVKAVALLVLGAVYLGAGLAVICRLSSGRTWMRFTKVDRIMASLPPRE